MDVNKLCPPGLIENGQVFIWEITPEERARLGISEEQSKAAHEAYLKKHDLPDFLRSIVDTEPLGYHQAPKIEPSDRWDNEVQNSPPPVEPRDICVCEHHADQHKWLNDPAPLRSRHLRCTVCDCGHFRERGT